MKATTLTAFPAGSENDLSQYFFGYFDKCPWNHSGRYLLAHRVEFENRMPAPDDEIDIGVIDVSPGEGAFTPVRTTRAWSWQQGAMLQWWEFGNLYRIQ
jgi:hypothetical protein